MRHGLLAVDVLARGHRVHDHLLVPVIGNRRHDAVDLLVVQECLIAARDGEVRSNDLPRQGVSAVVEVTRGSTFDARQFDGCAQQPGPLHADADHAEADPVAGRNGLRSAYEIAR